VEALSSPVPVREKSTGDNNLMLSVGELLEAVRENKYIEVERLLKSGVDPDETSGEEYPPLIEASKAASTVLPRFYWIMAPIRI